MLPLIHGFISTGQHFFIQERAKSGMKGIFANKDVFSVVLGFGKYFVYQLEHLAISEENDIYDDGLVVTKVRS